jgi:hypothetical protein
METEAKNNNWFKNLIANNPIIKELFDRFNLTMFYLKLSISMIIILLISILMQIFFISYILFQNKF